MPEKRKGEQAPRDAAADETRSREERTAAKDETYDPREEEGYDQPESSAQKQPPER